MQGADIDMEKWDLYTKYREKTGKEHIRGEKLPEDLYHLVVHIWIRNRKGEYLISQRSANRSANPLMWESVGGSVLKGESSVQGAIREVKEERGVSHVQCTWHRCLQRQQHLRGGAGKAPSDCGLQLPGPVPADGFPGFQHGQFRHGLH